MSETIEHWARVNDFFIELHDKKKECQMKSMYAYYLILKETARRFKLEKNDLEWLFVEEIKKIILGSIYNKKVIIKRKQAVVAMITKKGIRIYEGKEANKIRNKELRTITELTDRLSGMGVTTGKVRGKAKICQGAEEAINKIKKGDILICPMTLPDYVPAMRRARAIVTNEGGITCHAAIIARELAIPCVVGTKIATKVFKDGDMIEVDAERGIVKKIK